MGEVYSKVGIISCSGEEIAEGSVARQAVRRVLEALRPQNSVTLCLPLFLAGEEGERRFAREHPTIAVDGCGKLCAKRGTEKFSGPVSASLIVSDIIGDLAKVCHRSIRHYDNADEKAVWLVADRIAAEVDALSRSQVQAKPDHAAATATACCACSTPAHNGTLEILGTAVSIAGLPLIFKQLRGKGLEPGESSGDALLKTVAIYHRIEEHEETDYRNALIAAYRIYCRQLP